MDHAMRVPVKLGLFGAALIIVFALGYLLGAVL